MPVRILFVVNDAAFFVSHRLPLALAARGSGYEVIVATGGKEGADEIRRAGLEYRSLPLRRGGANPLRELKLVFAIARLFREVRPDIIHLVTIKPVLYGGLLSRLMRVPGVVMAVSGMGYLFVDRRSGVLRRMAEVLYRYALNHPNGTVIVQNVSDRDQLRDMGALRRGQDVLIPGSGVDLEQYAASDVPDGVPLIVLPARMLWDKGVGEFVEAARMLRGRGINARFALVGPCDTENPAGVPLYQLEDWKESGVVEWWGARSDMPRVYSMASLVVLPSYREGLPKALLEAASSARAIVTTDAPGCRDVVEDGVNGRLVPVRDVGALAGAIAELISDREVLIRMGRRGREKAETNFGLTKVVEMHMNVYRSLCPVEAGIPKAERL